MSDDERSALVRQLIGIIGNRLLDPLEILLGSPDDVTLASFDQLCTACERSAGYWADRLLGPDDTDARYASASLIGALYPSDTAFDPPASWWQTPLGRIVARRAGHPGASAVSYSVAGAMLGVTRQGVHDLVTRGKLERHPDGGVTVESVRDRINLHGQRSVT
jgi:hypothetical protein